MVSIPRTPSRRLPIISQCQQRHLGNGLLAALQIIIEGLDCTLVVRTELFELLLLLQLFDRILCSLTEAFHLLWVNPPRTAVGTELNGVQDEGQEQNHGLSAAFPANAKRSSSCGELPRESPALVMSEQGCA